MSSSKSPKGKTQEQIVAGFQELRQQQRNIASRIAEVEMDMKEHELVIETLKEVAPDRRCYRMVGGVLVERTVGDVLPTLTTNKEQMSQFVETMGKQLESKGKEINAYREENNIRIRGEEDPKAEAAAVSDSKSGSGSGGVLVANSS
ncbi:prefoldin subunit 2-like [Babylonia areolata]|uniref:prefoldin subunit 2-like n=1 Tax=Babylonia areolata TaxID=304850 RepID=UPI003FD4CF80